MCHSKYILLKLNKFLLFLAVLLTAGIFFLNAQEPDNENIAYLLEGPIPETGVPGIGENVIPSYRGTYSYNGKRIKVFYTAEEIIVFSDWENINNSGFLFHKIEDRTLCYINRDKWTLFIEYESPDSVNYDFASELCRKMLFFAKTEEFFKVSSFPAIINISR